MDHDDHDVIGVVGILQTTFTLGVKTPLLVALAPMVDLAILGHLGLVTLASEFPGVLVGSILLLLLRWLLLISSRLCPGSSVGSRSVVLDLLESRNQGYNLLLLVVGFAPRFVLDLLVVLGLGKRHQLCRCELLGTIVVTVKLALDVVGELGIWYSKVGLGHVGE